MRVVSLFLHFIYKTASSDKFETQNSLVLFPRQLSDKSLWLIADGLTALGYVSNAPASESKRREGSLRVTRRRSSGSSKS